VQGVGNIIRKVSEMFPPIQVSRKVIVSLRLHGLPVTDSPGSPLSKEGSSLLISGVGLPRDSEIVVF
jgi:hypothetical protein